MRRDLSGRRTGQDEALAGAAGPQRVDQDRGEPAGPGRVPDAVEAQRQCCRFLRFEITVEPDGGPISLELSGPPGTREFIAALLDS